MQQVLQDKTTVAALISILLQLAASLQPMLPFRCKFQVLLQLLVACCNLFHVLSFKFYLNCDVGFNDNVCRAAEAGGIADSK